MKEETTTIVITKRDRNRVGEVDRRKSLTENVTTVIDLYERSLMSPAQIDAMSPSETSNAEWVIERALMVLHGKKFDEEQ